MESSVAVFVSYIISQLLDRWIDVSHIKNIDYNMSEACDAWNREQWFIYLRQYFQENEQTSQLYQKICLKFQDPLEVVVKTILQHVALAKKLNAKTILISDPRYPELLRVIKDPPIGINVMGDLNLLNYPKVSLVGARKACRRSLFESYELGKSLAVNGIAVVSGGAYGCDIAVHQGVLSAGLAPCPAIIVFAGGLNSLYPKGNIQVFHMIAQYGGLLVSERLNMAIARPFDFPIRNRIVSGVSRETIVIQADMKSGAMVTARLALDQGRDVSVLEFDEEDEVAAGNTALIADGAIRFNSAKDWFDGALDDFHFYY